MTSEGKTAEQSKAGDEMERERAGSLLDCENRAGGRTGYSRQIRLGTPFEWTANLISAIGDPPTARQQRNGNDVAQMGLVAAGMVYGPGLSISILDEIAISAPLI